MRARVGRGRRDRGFTLIELLVVIAIIAILAGLLLPVINIVKLKAAQGQCASQMAEMIRAVKMYRDDWRVYPDALYAIDFGGGPQNRLFPEYVKDEKTFNCPLSMVKVRPAGQRAYVTPNNMMFSPPQATPFGLADFSSYEVQYRPNTRNPAWSELHYNPKWTLGAPNITDDPRQLVYKNPPDSTVVTWCLYHARMDAGGVPAVNEVALVAFLSGRVQTLPAEKVSAWPAPDGSLPWQVTPRP